MARTVRYLLNNLDFGVYWLQEGRFPCIRRAIFITALGKADRF